MSNLLDFEDDTIIDDAETTAINPNVSDNKHSVAARFSKTIWRAHNLDEDEDDMDIPDEVSNCKLIRPLLSHFIINYTQKGTILF